MSRVPAVVTHVGASDPSTNSVNVLSAMSVPLVTLITNVFSVLKETSLAKPVIFPVLVKFKPLGKDPACMLYLKVPLPVATSCCSYSTRSSIVANVPEFVCHLIAILYIYCRGLFGYDWFFVTINCESSISDFGHIATIDCNPEFIL